MVYIDFGGTPKQALASIAALDHVDLCKAVLSDELNTLIRSGENQTGDQLIPYIGWFWRDLQFFQPRGMTIAKEYDTVAFCQNNKWDYPERHLMPEEQDHFTGMVWEAMQVSRTGGQISEIRTNYCRILKAAGDYIRNLEF